MGTWILGAIPLDAPATIALGHYDLAGVVDLISDVSSTVPSPIPYRLVTTCLGEMTVVAGMSITIKASFGAGKGCIVSVATVPDAPESSAGLDGVVPPGSMTLSVQNGSNLEVTVFVNDLYVTTLAPGECPACQGDDGILARSLPPLPWQAEVRTQSGRVLVASPVRSGDVIRTSNSWKGDAARVDLSCGRIDVWSGPPLAGPAPGQGTPGDCAP